MGNHDFSKSVYRTVKYAHRVVNKADAITHFPPCLSFDGSTCSELFGLGYFHTGQEIWYPGGSSRGAEYIASSSNESPNGSNSLHGRYEISDHIKYFGLGDPKDFIKNKCLG